jgi:iron(III) transport system substrate-binding protein
MRGLSRRTVAGGLAALGGAALLPRRAHADLAVLEAAARREGAITWYIAQMDAQTAESMGRAFTARYPGIEVTVIRTTGQVAYQRLLLELKSNSPHCDVLSSTDISHYAALKARGALAHYVPENAAGLAPAFDGLGEAGLYYPTTSTLHVLTYNTQTVKPEDAPRTWLDLLDPRWKNQVATGHPAFSGYTGIWVLAMRKLYGWEYFDRLAKNQPRIGRSGLDPLTMLNARECQVACGPLSGVLLSADKGNPITIRYPDDGSVLCIGPAGVLADAPHPNAGRLFLEWLLSVEFARECVAARIDPVRSEVQPKPGTKKLSELKLVRLTPQEIGNGIPEVIEQWRDTFGG